MIRRAAIGALVALSAIVVSCSNKPNQNAASTQSPISPKQEPAFSQGRPQQLNSTPLLDKAVGTDNVSCLRDWLSSQSAILESPAGADASVELRGEALLGKTEADNRCVTTWTLRIAANGTSRIISVGTFDFEWDDYTYFFEMNGWSKDGQRLLMSMVTWYGDWNKTTPVVYEVQGQQIRRTELDPLFQRIAPKDCPLHFLPLGFSPSGQVLFDVFPGNASDLAPGEKACFQESRWQLDYVQKVVTRASPNAIAEKFGTLIATK